MNTAYHLTLLAFSAAALWTLHRRPRIGVLAAIAAGMAVVGWSLARVLSASFGAFAFLRLSALGVFVHAPILLAGCAWVFRRRPRFAVVLLAAAVSLTSIAVYSTRIEPRWLEVSRVEIQSAKLHRPIRVAVIADLQAEAFGAYERRALEAALATEPDLVLLPGDYFQIGDPTRWNEVARQFREYLRSSGFGAPMGAFAVRGDVETSGWTSLFDGTRVATVDPQPGSFTMLRLPELDLTALSPEASRSHNLALTASSRFHIVFGHAPDFALGEVPADLLIAGHVHGGQVRLPFLGPLITFSAVPRSWAAGVTDLGGGRTLVVSRGVGMERGHAPRLRFLCRPEIVVIDLLPAPLHQEKRQ
ncbi:MAG: metallophosphoesterase [Thermoanaerobaculia bacterium]